MTQLKHLEMGSEGLQFVKTVEGVKVDFLIRSKQMCAYFHVFRYLEFLRQIQMNKCMTQKKNIEAGSTCNILLGRHLFLEFLLCQFLK